MSVIRFLKAATEVRFAAPTGARFAGDLCPT